MRQAEFATELFYSWEKTLRGWQIYDRPVEIEPSFGLIKYTLPDHMDDGRFRLIPKRRKDSLSIELPDTYEYQQSGQLACIGVHLTRNAEYDPLSLQEFLLLSSRSSHPITFEILANSESIQIQWVCTKADESNLLTLLEVYFPSHRHFRKELGRLPLNNHIPAIIDFGLSNEVMLPIQTGVKNHPDPYQALYSSFNKLSKGEVVLLQVSFHKTSHPWPERLKHSILLPDGKPLFPDSPELAVGLKDKLDTHLIAGRLRISALGQSIELIENRVSTILQSLGSFDRSGGNNLIPLSNEGIDLDDHIECIESRTSVRPGFLLNISELSSLVHYPGSSVQIEKLFGKERKTHPVPNQYESGVYNLGTNHHIGESREVLVSDQERLRHMHIIGATGTGKSNFLIHLIKQDLQKGNGLCVLDPHGDLIEWTLCLIPESRIKDVVLIDPSDEEFPVGLNLLNAKSEPEKILLSSDLVALFRRYATSWGDQMTAVLANAVNAFLNRDHPGTLVDLKRFLTEKKFRNEVLKSIDDPGIIYYWEKEFPLLRSNSVASILTRLDTFLRSPLIRNMMVQPGGVDFHQSLEDSRIVLVKLSQGLIGEENSHLLGSIVISKIHQAALHRQRMDESKRKPFFLYVDEFQNFITPSMTSILSGARKYGLGLIMAHQDMEQLRSVDRSLANSILSNPSIRMSYRCGERDAREISQGFTHFGEEDFHNLGTGEAIARIQKAENDFSLSMPLVDIPRESITAKAAIESSRSQWASTKEEVNNIIRNLYGADQRREVIAKDEEILDSNEFYKDIDPKAEIKEDAEAFKKLQSEKKELREHQSLQEMIKRSGEQFGFHSTKEFQTQGGGRIDVVLESKKHSIAIEVAVTNTVEYEIQNIQKCIDEGFKDIVVCSTNQSHRENIAKAFKKPKSSSTKVSFFSPTELLNHIESKSEKIEKEQIIRGYSVNVNYETVSEKEQEEKRKQVVKAVLKGGKKKQ